MADAPKLSQTNRQIQVVKSPLPDLDDLIAMRIVGSEGTSRPFRFVVDFVSGRATIPPANVLGKPFGFLVFGMKQSDVSTTSRIVHGRVSRWAELGSAGTSGLTRYRAELVPWVWMLSLSAECRTFEDMTVQKILEQVFKELDFADFKFRLTGTLPTLAYVAQYEESNLAFMSRLLEDAGLYYVFEYASDKHTLVITDSVGSVVPPGTLASLPVSEGVNNGLLNKGGRLGGKKAAGAAGDAVGGLVGGVVGSVLGPFGTLAGGLAGGGVAELIDRVVDLVFPENTEPPADSVTELLRERVVHTKTVAASEFHLERASSTAVEVSTDPGVTGDVHTFLGDLAGTPQRAASPAEAKRRIEAEESGHDVIRGASTAPPLTPGTRVTIKGGAMGAAGVEVHVTEVAHVMEAGDVLSADAAATLKYVNEFTAIPIATQLRPERVTARPSVRGTQTALVVGEGGAGAIDVDATGSVLLQFPWDRGAGAAAKSKHRVHVASVWAGVGWGALQLPRVGQLVLVEFLEGDPARPIVTGRVYSKDHAHPYALPANKTQSGIKSRTLGGTEQNFNELRFEDKKGAEQVFVHAEKDLQVTVKAAEARTVGATRTANVQGNDTHEVEKGDQTLHVKSGNQAFKVDSGDQTTDVAAGNRTATISADDKVDANFIGLTAKEQIQLKVASSVMRMGTAGIHMEAGQITMEAKTKFELKVGASTITVTPSDITLAVGPSSVKIDAAGVKTAAAMIEQAANASNKVTGAMVTVEGQAMTTVKGALTQITGSALLKAGGGVSMFG